MSTLRELEAAATHAPWAIKYGADEDSFGNPILYVESITSADGVIADFADDYGTSYSANGRLIAAARNALPLLLDVVDAARLVHPDFHRDPAACGCEIADALYALDSEPLP